MKKIYKVFASLIFIFSAMLMFFACGNKSQVLATPVSVGIVNNDVYNPTTNEYIKTEILLVTDKNKYASGYKFFITNNSNFSNLDNYITLTSSTNSVDITSYFNKAETYHYFVQYIGSKNYKNSEYSQTKTYTPPTESLNTPYPQLIDEQLSWFRIMNATGYEVYEKVLNSSDEVITENTKITTLNSETFTLDLTDRFADFNAPYNKYVYSVKAISSGQYNSSALSQSVTYIKHVNLSTPENLEVTTQNSKYILNWDAVDYATSYQVVVNGNTANPITTTENSLDITQYLTHYSTFSFSVKAKTSDVISYIESNYSETLTYDYTTKLLSPENLNITREGEYITITWDSVSLAETYTLVIIYNGEERYTASSLELTNASVEIEAYLGDLTTDKNITVKVKANNASHYILESEFTEVNYTILKTAETEPSIGNEAE